jgi:hypothetical protein
MVLGLMGIAGLGICGGSEEVNQEIIAQGEARKTIVSRAAFPNKVVIGVLDFETSGPSLPPSRLEKWKKLLIKELRRNSRVKVKNIRESCGLSDLKGNGYEQAKAYKKKYRLDMLLHTHMAHPRMAEHDFSFSLIDLYGNKVKKVDRDMERGRFVLWVDGMSSKILVDKDLDRVLKAKKTGLPK